MITHLQSTWVQLNFTGKAWSNTSNFQPLTADFQSYKFVTFMFVEFLNIIVDQGLMNVSCYKWEPKSLHKHKHITIELGMSVTVFADDWQIWSFSSSQALAK